MRPNDDEQEQESGAELHEDASARLLDAMSSLQTLSKSRMWMEEQYRRLSKWFFLSLALLAVSLSANVLQIALRPEPVYFAQTPDLRITEMVPLGHPRESDAGVANWTAQLAVKTMSMDYLHWRDDLMSVKDSYTDKAFGEMVKSLRDSGVTDMMESKKVVVRVTLTSAPIIAAKGPDEDGAYGWRMEFPLIVSYETSNGVVSNQTLDVTATVVRVPVSESPVGIRVKQLVMRPTAAKPGRK
jgi:intracellular multiplication protein IcmL